MIEFSYFYKLFLNSIKDYEIKEILEMDSDIAEDLMLTFLLKGLARFDNCHKDLENIDLDLQIINENLSLKEIIIIIDWMIIAWAERNNSDLLLSQATLGDADFRRTPQYMILRANEDNINIRRERVQQDMINYDLKNTPFKEWSVGNYGL